MDEADKGRMMTTIGVSWRMFLLLLAHPGCPRQNPESRKTAVCVCVCVCARARAWKSTMRWCSDAVMFAAGQRSWTRFHQRWKRVHNGCVQLWHLSTWSASQTYVQL